MNQKAIIGQYFKEYKLAVKERKSKGKKADRYVIIRSPRGSVLVSRKQLGIN